MGPGGINLPELCKTNRLFRSGFRNPFLNLSLETYLFKNLPANGRRLLLYTNEPCVVIGRNQNPWRECNVPLLQSLSVPLVRRRSGGGTVVHDTGNVNFSVMMPRAEFARDTHAQMIVDQLNKLPPVSQKVVPTAFTGGAADAALPFSTDGSYSPIPGGASTDGSEGILVQAPGPQVKLKVNERYDIVTDPDNKKVSGSAFKIEREKAYHHGTMLLNAKLDVLSALLHRDVHRMGTVHGRGVESVKSPVCNIGCDSDVFMREVIDGFKTMYDIDEPVIEVCEDDLPQEIIDEAVHMQTWQWAFAQTPDFEHTLIHPEYDFSVTFKVSKGVVTDVLGSDLFKKAISSKYRGIDLAEAIPEHENWLKYAIDGAYDRPVTI
ncbi:hypothetical protein TRVA0_033S01552 [Trichomonascus vanleenenianus]|uniref:putative lipoate--protein ligase n=1 Tax=Trichomonascus vanleenenianus TaxID=2268995 RepID=UPI003EC9A523